MKFLRILLITGIILTQVTPSWPEEAGPESADKEVIYLSLNEVLQIALINNFDVQLAHYDRLIRETDIDSAMSIYDTVFTLTADYEYNKSKKPTIILGKASHTGSVNTQISKKFITGTDVTIDYENRRESTDSAFVTMNPYYESIVRMKFTQPLLRNFFGMNDWGQVRITKIDVKNYSSEILDRVEKDLAKVEKAYWDVVVAVKLVEMGKRMYQRAEEFYKINVEKSELGTSELGDLLAAEANLKTRKTELDVEVDTLKSAVNKLRFLINHPKNDVDILPIETAEIKDREIIFLQSLKTAFVNRRDYKRAKQDIKAKKIKFNMKKNERWPQLDLEGSLSLNGVERVYDSATGNAFSKDNPTYYAKATFSFPFEDRKGRSEYNKAKNEKAKALVSLKKVEKTIVTEIDDVVRKVNLDKNRTQERLKIEELQRRKLEEENKQYGFGRSDSDRIIRFQEDLLQAKIAALKALRDYKSSLVDLYVAENIFLDKRGLTIQ